MEYLTHFDEAAFERQEVEGSDIDALWQDLGRAAGSVNVGLARIRFEPGKRPTPAHDHGAEEEIFYVLAGSGLSWRAGETHDVRAGDCLVYRPAEGAHTLVAGSEHYSDYFADTKLSEFQEWHSHVSSWEVDRYLTLF